MLLKSRTKTILLSGASLGTCVVSQVYCCALATSSMKIRDIVVHPVYASASAWPLLQCPTQNPTRTFPLWMLLQCPLMWRWRWSFLPAQLLLPYIERAINSTRGATLSTIECEIPTTAALVTGSNRKVTSEVDMESRLCNDSSWTDNWPPQENRMSDIKIMWDIVETANPEILGHGFIERARKTTEKFNVFFSRFQKPSGKTMK